MTNTGTNGASTVIDDEHPVWQDDGVTDVQSLFKNPYFVDAAHRTQVAQDWYDHMKKPFKIFLFDKDGQPNNVFDWAYITPGNSTGVPDGSSIYEHIFQPGGDMPLPVTNFSGKFPPEACEKFRRWYNDGGRVTKADSLR